jgi:hypothetical protein
MYRLIRRIEADIVYIDNGNKKRLAGILADDETMTNLKEAKVNPRFKPAKLAQIPPYTGNKVEDVVITYTDSDTNKRVKLSSQRDIVSITKEYEDFVNLYKSSNVKSENKFELVKGEDILKYYHENSYAYQKGQLGNSCMKHDHCQDYFGIYVENPKTCNLLVYLNSRGQVLGRAIMWKVSKAPCDAKYFMDRIYTSSDSDIIKFKNYANESWGWFQ